MLMLCAVWSVLALKELLQCPDAPVAAHVPVAAPAPVMASSSSAALAAAAVAAAASPDLANEVESFRRDGFLVNRGLLSREEIILIRDALEMDKELLDKKAVRNNGAASSFSKVVHLARLDNGTLGTSLRLGRVVRLLRALLNEHTDVMHWMTRLIHKLPKRGGEWAWHQDFAYWRQDGFRRPDMVTVYITLDNQTLDNGPLRLLRSSHQMGLSQDSASQGADSERLNDAIRRFPEVVPLLRSGDVMFIDSLVYHSSSGNYSPVHRRALTAVYTRADNIGDDGSNCCRRIDEVDDMALREQGAAIGLDAASLVDPHGYLGNEAKLRHGYSPWVSEQEFTCERYSTFLEFESGKAKPSMRPSIHRRTMAARLH